MSEVATRADFTQIRYAQVWEDPEVLLAALQVQPGDHCVSIASAGDNALALLTGNPDRVFALDLNPSQIACLELRCAALQELAHGEFLELLGSRRSTQRADFYRRCRPLLATPAREFWDARSPLIDAGIATGGRFENYFATFRESVLPWVHSRKTIKALLQPRSREERLEFYETRWNTLRWRTLFRLFFSRFVMGKLGRSAAQFRYVEGSVGDRILARARHALVELDPSQNPWLHWILLGEHRDALPVAWQEKNFAAIRENLPRLEWRCQSVEDFLEENSAVRFSKFNLSDIFEYMSEENYRILLEKVVASSKCGARLAYWNMLVPRSRPDSLAAKLHPLTALEDQLHNQDRAFFYSRFVVEEVT
ncbi:MAG TPA: DUF3419 family protein [Chthoniobacterales bacterium]|jgi:S-adenosylmethionine-diacylglycerol 3-amino-3-carboxypropyl transferase